MKTVALRQRLEGVEVIMVTPFTADQEIDEEGLRRNVRFLLNAGHTWLTPTGSVGEFPSLTGTEHRRVIEIVLEETNGKDVIVTPGCGGNSTKSVIEMAQWCRNAGCDGLMIPPPSYYPSNVNTAKAHYMAINDAVDIGIILYYFPTLHHFHISSAQLIDLLQSVPNIVGIKDSALDIIKMERYIRAVGDKVACISAGGEFMAAYTYMVGAPAMISSIANYWPELPLKMHNAATCGDFVQVLQMMQEVGDFLDFLYDNQSTFMIKRAMEMRELAGGPVRLPQLGSLTDEQEETLQSFLQQFGLL